MNVRKLSLLERALATLLQSGTWLATAVIGVGLILAINQSHTSSGMDIVKIGVSIFILLPILRVALMLFAFLIKGDYRYVAIAVSVLAIISASFALGVLTSKSPS